MKISTALLREKQIISERIPDDEREVFDGLCDYYKKEEDLKIFFIRYRHYLKDIYDPKWGTVIYEPLSRPIRIGYLLNTDIVFYSKHDSSFGLLFLNI